MTRAEDLLKALNGLRKAVDSKLSGEAHEEALLYIEELFRLAGFDGEDGGDGGSEPAPAFTDAVAEVRAQAEGELSGNAFQLASSMLDDLAALSSAPASHAAAEAPEAKTPPPGLSFDELAAAAKTRVEQIAVTLGVEAVQHYGAPTYEQHEVQAQQDEMLADLEFEKRSSEPCSMPEIVILPEKAAPTAAASADARLAAASAREVAEATHDFGTPAAEAGPVAEYAAPREKPPGEPEPKPAAAAPAPEPAPVIITKAEPRRASSATESAAATNIEAAPKREKEPEKTFFSIWLDMVFGRKR